MARQLVILGATIIRQRLADWIMVAPVGTRIEIKDPQRTLEQNNKMWACLTDVSHQLVHQATGLKYTPNDWKAIFMRALGREMEFLPELEGHGFFPTGYHSSDLSKAEMSELIEFILAEGTKRGVRFHEPKVMT